MLINRNGYSCESGQINLLQMSLILTRRSSTDSYFLVSIISQSVLNFSYLLILLQVMRSIKDNITQDDLLDEINEIIRLPMYADRIRIDSKANQHANMARRR